MKYEEYDSLIMSKEKGIYYITDVKTCELLHLTRSGMDLYGLTSPEEYAGRKCYEVLQGLDAPCPFCTRNILREGAWYKWEYFNEKLGSWFEAEDTLINIEGRLCRLERTKDISSHKKALRRLSDQLTMEDVLLESIQIMAKEEDAGLAFRRFLEKLGRFHRASRAYIFELDKSKKFINNTYQWCGQDVAAEKDVPQQIPVETISTLIDEFERKGEFYIDNISDVSQPLSSQLKLLKERNIKSFMAAPLYSGNEFVGVLAVENPTNKANDLTLLRASANFVTEELRKTHLIQSLKYASYTDLLTGLYNRNKYSCHIEQLQKNPPESLGIVFSDFNGLKQVNDTFGHRQGDEKLKELAEILKNFTRGKSYRIGGDEFVLIFKDISKGDFEKTLKTLRDTTLERGCTVAIGSSFGEVNVDVNSLIFQADKAMYDDKAQYYLEAKVR